VNTLLLPGDLVVMRIMGSVSLYNDSRLQYYEGGHAEHHDRAIVIGTAHDRVCILSTRGMIGWTYEWTFKRVCT
jgi:hypothetical protein